jgi:hypothetical protein
VCVRCLACSKLESKADVSMVRDCLVVSRQVNDAAHRIELLENSVADVYKVSHTRCPRCPATCDRARLRCIAGRQLERHDLNGDALRPRNHFSQGQNSCSLSCTRGIAAIARGLPLHCRCASDDSSHELFTAAYATAAWSSADHARGAAVADDCRGGGGRRVSR